MEQPDLSFFDKLNGKLTQLAFIIVTMHYQ